MNNYKELIKRLRWTAANDDGVFDAETATLAADAIETLTAELAEERHRHDRLQDWDRGMTEHLEKIKAERDALLKIMRDDADCDYCKHDLPLPCGEEIVETCEGCTREKTPCCGCEGNNWEWRGAKEETQ